MNFTRDFSLQELACKDGTPVPYELKPLAITLLINLQTIRNVWDRPLIITSGYRTWEHNLKVGGSPISFHLLAMAADFYVEGVPLVEVYDVIHSLIRAGAISPGGLGGYDTFIHYDLRGHFAKV